MKRLDHRCRALGRRPCKAESILFGVDPGRPLTTPDELDAEREAIAERRAIQAVAREEEAEDARAREAARPRTFAPPPGPPGDAGRSTQASLFD